MRQEWRVFYDANYTRQAVRKVGLFSVTLVPLGWRMKSWADELVDFRKVHAISKLHPTDLAGMKLDFQICRQDGNVNGFPLCRVGAFCADLVQFQVAVMRLYKFVNDRVHVLHCSSGWRFHKSPKDLRRALRKL
jgi:hypothetical protein